MKTIVDTEDVNMKTAVTKTVDTPDKTAGESEYIGLLVPCVFVFLNMSFPCWMYIVICTVFFFFHILSIFYVWSMFLMSRLRWTRSCASSPESSLSPTSRSWCKLYSIHLRSGLPLLLFPGTYRHHSLAHIFILCTVYVYNIVNYADTHVSVLDVLSMFVLQSQTFLAVYFKWPQ